MNIRRFLPRALPLCFAAVFLASCSKQPKLLTFPVLPGGTQIGTSVQGRPIELLKLGNGPETVLIIATIHGNENAGTPLVRKMVSYLDDKPALLKGRTLVIVPVANPDGYARNMRYNSRGIDLNRNFAASNRESNVRYGVTQLSEPESKLIVQLLEQYKPSRIVSIHQPLTCIDFDGPGAKIAEHMGRYTDLPVKQLGSRPGSLGSYAGVDMQIPIITFELPRKATRQNESELWRRYGRSLLAAVTYPAEPPPLLAIPVWAVALTLLVIFAVAVFVILRLRLDANHAAV